MFLLQGAQYFSRLPMHKTRTGIFTVVQCCTSAVSLIGRYLQCQGFFFFSFFLLMLFVCVLMVVCKLHHLLNQDPAWCRNETFCISGSVLNHWAAVGTVSVISEARELGPVEQCEFY